MSMNCKEGGNKTEGQIEELKKKALAFFVELSLSATQPPLNITGLRHSCFPVMEETLPLVPAKLRISYFTLGKNPPFIASQQKMEPLSGRPETQVGGGDAFLRREACRARRNFLFFYFFTETDDQLIEHNVVGKRCPPH